MKKLKHLPLPGGGGLRGRGIILLLLLTASLSAAPVLFEAYQEGTITIPGDKIDTVTVVELSFSVDTSCYVLFTAGGLSKRAKLFLYLDGSKLFPTTALAEVASSSFHTIYTYLLGPEDHNVHLKLTNLEFGASADCYDAYLQALIFLPDAGSAVAEPPGDNHQPQVMRSVVSKGPFVHVAGASELVDASGRVIEDAIHDDKVFISNLPQGTYFARNGDRTVVKIVKVE
ncbi:MAG: hypothetical protein U9Q76_01335 [candidate division WOR-3 bacterium]|nr:hypothetical protein [candidate division WOR-3 bacterium]